jgi:hypothetical protein
MKTIVSDPSAKSVTVYRGLLCIQNRLSTISQKLCIYFPYLSRNRIVDCLEREYEIDASFERNQTEWHWASAYPFAQTKCLRIPLPAA